MTFSVLGAAIRTKSPDYADGLVNDDGLEWLDRVEAVCLSPHDLAERLRELADIAHIAQSRPDCVTPDGALRLIRDELRDLAWRAVPS